MNLMTHSTMGPLLKKFSGQTQWSGSGENVANGYKTPQSVFDGWMSSPGHRENILQNSYTDMGLGEHNGYWTQLFGNNLQSPPVTDTGCGNSSPVALKSQPQSQPTGPAPPPSRSPTPSPPYLSTSIPSASPSSSAEPCPPSAPVKPKPKCSPKRRKARRAV